MSHSLDVVYGSNDSTMSTKWSIMEIGWQRFHLFGEEMAMLFGQRNAFQSRIQVHGWNPQNLI